MKKTILRLIIGACMIVFIVCGVLLTQYFVESKESADNFSELSAALEPAGQRKISAIAVIGSADGPMEVYTATAQPDDAADSDDVEWQRIQRMEPESESGELSLESQDMVGGEPPPPIQAEGSRSRESTGTAEDQFAQEAEPLLPSTPVATPKPLPARCIALRKLAERNSDMVGWLMIDGTKIDYPVMSSKDDAEYYLHRDFDHKESKHGVPFIGAFCDVDKPTDNVLIYGHHMRDGSMFTDLMSYEKLGFWRENPVIHFDTLESLGDYVVIAAFTVSASAKDYQYNRFTDASRDPGMFDEYVAFVKKNALYETGFTAEYGEKLLTLSTCEYTRNNGRMVVVAKRITLGDDAD